MKIIHCVSTFLFAAALSAEAQTCNDHIAQGRSLLEASNVVAANASFASALALCPQNEVARFYHAATALAALPFRAGPSNFLDRIGMPREGRSLYEWTAVLPRDTNGHLIVPPGFNATEATTILRNDVLSAVIAAGQDLAQIQNSTFAAPLSYEETKVADVTVDYGDVQLLRAGLHALELWAYSLYSWNFDAHLAVIEQLHAGGQLSIERVLRDFPQLLTFATTNDLAAAKTALENAVARYLEGSAFVRARPANLVRLFNYDLEEAEREERFRCTLADLRNSLQTPTVLCVDSNYVIYLANYFTGRTPPRAWLPRFAGNHMAVDSFPDNTFGGVVGGLSMAALEEGISERVNMVSTIQNPSMASTRRFSCEFPALPNRVYALEFSSDLQSWTPLLEFYSEGGTYAFLDGGARNSRYRFYRLAELYRFVTVDGLVRDRCSLLPVPGARVELSPRAGEPAQTVLSDANGRFSYRARFGEGAYIVANAYAYWGEGSFNGKEESVIVDVVPVFTTQPANDNFGGRTRLSGFPAATYAVNCGADYDADYCCDFWLGANSIWFSWTAPATVPVVIKAEGTLRALITVFTGSSVENLHFVESGAPEARFDATAGTTYHISVGGLDDRPGEFRLVISAPPALAWVSPEWNQEFTAPATIPFEIGAWDADNNIREARYYANGDLIGRVTAPPFNFTWENVPEGYYRFQVEVEDAEGFVTSDFRPVYVRPRNDAFANRLALQGSPVRVDASNKGATSEAAEPSHAGEEPGSSVWWTWRAPETRHYTMTVTPEESNSDAELLAVYTGADLNTLNVVADGRFFGWHEPRQVSFLATAQTDYQIAVSGWGTGEFRLRIFPGARPTVNIVSPTNGTVATVAANIDVQVQATDPDNNITSVEFFLNSTLFLKTNVAAFTVQLPGLPEGYYELFARVRDTAGTVGVSEVVGLEVRPVPPANDNFADRISIAGTSGRLTGTTVGGTKEPGEPGNTFPLSGNSVWWTWTAPANGWLSLRDAYSWYKRVHVFRGTAVSSLTSVGYQDAYSIDFLASVQAGVAYHIAVEGLYGYGDSVDINLGFLPTP